MKKIIVAMTVALSLGACSTAQIESSAATIEGDIQAGSAALCGIIPTIGTILTVVTAVAGGGTVSGLVGAGITAVENDICSAAPPAASARYKALPRANAGTPAAIGVSKSGVAVAGWRS